MWLPAVQAVEHKHLDATVFVLSTHELKRINDAEFATLLGDTIPRVCKDHAAYT